MFSKIPDQAKSTLSNFIDGGDRIEASFTPLADGFFVKKGAGSHAIRHCSPCQRSRRFDLARILRPILEISHRVSLDLPTAWSDAELLRIDNGKIQCWTASGVFHAVAFTSSARARLEDESRAIEKLRKGPYASIIPRVTYGTEPVMNYRSELLFPIAHDRENLSRLDAFLGEHFAKLYSYGRETGTKPPIHGDFHINNILQTSDGRFILIDWDMMTPESDPALDIISFATHYTGFFVYGDYMHALELAIDNPKELFEAMAGRGLHFALGFLDACSSDAVREQFMKHRLDWLNRNDIAEPIHCRIREMIRAHKREK